MSQLGFGDEDDDPISVPSVTICGLFDRIGYTGTSGDSQLEKKHLFGQWRYLFHVVTMCLGDDERFLLYPRFLTMVFDRKLPELVKTGAPIRISGMNKRIFADYKPKKDNRIEIPLFGHVIDPDYIAQENDAWMHPEEEEEQDDDPQSPPHQPQPH